MKKFFKILLILLIVLIVVGGGFALFVEIRGIPTYEAKDPGIKVESTPARVERGREIGRAHV